MKRERNVLKSDVTVNWCPRQYAFLCSGIILTGYEPRINLLLCVIMLHLTLGASEIVDQPSGCNTVEKSSQRDTARKEHLNVAVGGVGVISDGKPSTNTETIS